MNVIENLRIPVPPIQEQDEIICYLDKNLSKFDVLVDNALRAVELLRERRSALISAAVTGKIDVRGWQPPAAQ
jgi:type I restriction enzyme S subunit